MMSMFFVRFGLLPFFACLGVKPVIQSGIQQIEYLSVVPFVEETMKFECYQAVNPSSMLNVRWFINNIEIVEAKYSNISPKNINKALLLQYHWDYIFKPNMNVKCMIEIVNPRDSVPLETHYSDDFVAGMIINNGGLHVTAREGDALRIPVKLTIPVVCTIPPYLPTHIKEFLKKMCGVRFHVSTPAYQANWNCKQTDIRDGSFNIEKCGLNFLNSNWNNTLYVTLQTVGSDYINYDTLFFLRLSVFEETIMGHAVDIWIGFSSPDVKILLHDSHTTIRKKACQINNGMHVSTFDGKKYEFNHTEGEYTIYTHKRLPVQVHAKLWSCQPNQLCICGVAVRSLDSLFEADFCSAANKQKQYMKKQICNYDDMTVLRIGNQVTITTQSATVTFSITSTDNLGILLQSSSIDFYLTSGLCGLLNDHVYDDLIPKGLNYNVNDIMKFSSSWRVNSTDSIFGTNRTQPLKIQLGPYCGCQGQDMNLYYKADVKCSEDDAMRCPFQWMQRHCETTIFEFS